MNEPIMRYKRETLMDMTRPLKDWLHAHKTNPYPTKEQKLELCKESNMTMTQICNWFANARRRLKHNVGKDDGSDLPGSAAGEINGHRHHLESEDSAWESGEDDASGRKRSTSNDASLSPSVEASQHNLPTVKTEINNTPPISLPSELSAMLSQNPLSVFQNLNVLYQGLASNNPAFMNQQRNVAQNPLVSSFPGPFLPFPANNSEKVNLNTLAQYQLYQQYLSGFLANQSYFPGSTAATTQTSTTGHVLQDLKSEVKTEEKPVVISSSDESGKNFEKHYKQFEVESYKSEDADSTVTLPPVKHESLADSTSIKLETPKYKNNLLARYLEGKGGDPEKPPVAPVNGVKSEPNNQHYPLDLTQTRTRFLSGSLGSRDSECTSDPDELAGCYMGSPYGSQGSGSSMGVQVTPSTSPGSDDIAPIEQMVANVENSQRDCPLGGGGGCPSGGGGGASPLCGGEFRPPIQFDNELMMKEVNAIMILTSMAMSRTSKVNQSIE